MYSKKAIDKGEKNLHIKDYKSWDKYLDNESTENLRIWDRNNID